MEFTQWLERADKWIFFLISHDCDHQWLDGPMILFRNPLTCIPLYIFILIYAVRKFEKRDACKFILLSLVVVVSAECVGRYSSHSSHASNHFGLAAFWYYTILAATGKRWNWLWIWATLICFAQVYVGKHYPSDILGGAVLGWLLGFSTFITFYKAPRYR